LFAIRERGSTIRTEIVGGITTFVAMAYIIVVNPAILAAAQFPQGASTVATILTAVFGTLLMGLYANRPIAVAPYMGENAGFVLIAALLHRRVPGAILIGIVVTALLGALLGHGKMPEHVVALPFTGAYSLAPLALELDVVSILRLSFLPILLTLFLMSLLDTLGTLVALDTMTDDKGDLQKPMLVDALACTFSGLIGTSTSGAYIESSTGIREGARTGLAAVVTATLFALSLFFIPLLEPMQSLQYAYAPALLIVGMLMLNAVTKIDFDDLTELVPAFTTVIVMVFTFNIANGLTAGLVLYPIMKVLAGRARELRAGMLVLAALCALYYVFGLPH
jgi:AGZA family xanthine/uracil permease-like MFS transporter